MVFLILGVVLQLVALAIQGIQCWLDARRPGARPGCSSTRATLPERQRGRRGRHRQQRLGASRE
jgi:hypothetical protein